MSHQKTAITKRQPRRKLYKAKKFKKTGLIYKWIYKSAQMRHKTSNSSTSTCKGSGSADRKASMNAAVVFGFITPVVMFLFGREMCFS